MKTLNKDHIVVKIIAESGVPDSFHENSFHCTKHQHGQLTTDRRMKLENCVAMPFRGRDPEIHDLYFILLP